MGQEKCRHGGIHTGPQQEHFPDASCSFSKRVAEQSDRDGEPELANCSKSWLVWGYTVGLPSVSAILPEYGTDGCFGVKENISNLKNRIKALWE